MCEKTKKVLFGIALFGLCGLITPNMALAQDCSTTDQDTCTNTSGCTWSNNDCMSCASITDADTCNSAGGCAWADGACGASNPSMKKKY